MLQLIPVEAGIIIPVRAQTKAKREGIIGAHAGQLKVAVTEAPEKGKANKAILRLLASKLHLSSSVLEIVSGQTSRDKKVLIRGLKTLDPKSLC